MLKYLFFAFLICSCSHDSQKNRLSTLEKLNGDNYNGGSIASPQMAIPLTLKEKRNNIKVAGKIAFGDELMAVPVRNETVYLEKDHKIVAQTTSDSKGVFSILTDIPFGDYSLVVRSSKYHGSFNIKIDKLSQTDLIIRVVKK